MSRRARAASRGGPPAATRVSTALGSSGPSSAVATPGVAAPLPPVVCELDTAADTGAGVRFRWEGEPATVARVSRSSSRRLPRYRSSRGRPHVPRVAGGTTSEMGS